MKKDFAGKMLGIGMAIVLGFGAVPVNNVYAEEPDDTGTVYYGDLNEDGIVNAKDVTLLRRYLANGWDVVIDEDRADVNFDEVVNAKDVTVLRRYLAGGWGVTLPKKTDDVISYPVAIDEEHFPDEAFRNYVFESFDEDEDESLSEEEANDVDGIYLAGGLGVNNLRGIEYFPNMRTLNCNGNALTSLDLSRNTALTWLNCSNNQITNIDLSNNRLLETLQCGGNQIETLDLSANTALTSLYCWRNNIKTLNLRNNRELVSFSCGSNQIENLDLSENTKLTELYCWDNKLSVLDLNSNTELTSLDCEGNPLTELDLSNNKELYYLFCLDTSIVRLDLSNNTKLTELACEDNVEVIRNVEISAEVFPDDIFREYISAFDTDGDEHLSTMEISAVNSINISGSNVESIHGIEVFGHLDNLYCSNTKIKYLYLGDEEETVLTISNIDARNNSELLEISCGYMKVDSLKVSGEKVERIYCSGNKLEELDVTGCPALKRLYCADNKLVSINVSENTALEYLYCRENLITELDLSNNMQLQESNVYCDDSVSIVWDSDDGEAIEIDEDTFPDEAFRNYVSENVDKNGDGVLSVREQSITSINCADLGIKDFTGIELFKELRYFNCSENWLTNIDLSKNTKLESLYASYNYFESLDLSQNTCLKELSLMGFGFRFDTLDLSENVNLTELYFNDSSLTVYRKIRLSKENYSNSKYRAFLQSFDENQDGFLDYEESHAVNDLDLNGLNITSVSMFNMFDDLDSLKANDVNIRDLNVSGMKVKKLDLSNNPNVIAFWSAGNGLEEFNADNSSIIEISIYNNYNLKRLDLSNVPDLKRLFCDNNGLIDLNIKKLYGLTELVCSRNALTTLDLSDNTDLEEFYCGDNKLSELNVSSNTKLTTLNCANNKLSTLDLSNNPGLNTDNVHTDENVIINWSSAGE